MINKIMLQLDQKSMSVKELAVEMNEAPPKVLKTVLGLVRDGRVKRDRVEDTTPYYIAVKPARESAVTPDARPIKGGVPAAQG